MNRTGTSLEAGRKSSLLLGEGSWPWPRGLSLESWMLAAKWQPYEQREIERLQLRKKKQGARPQRRTEE